MFAHSMNIFFLPVGESSTIKGELGTREHHHFIPHNHKKKFFEQNMKEEAREAYLSLTGRA